MGFVLAPTRLEHVSQNRLPPVCHCVGRNFWVALNLDAQTDLTMFTYLNPGIRERLSNEGKLFQIDAEGKRLAGFHANAVGQSVQNILGPIPLPISKGGESLEAQWYACVRATDLSEVEAQVSLLSEHEHVSQHRIAQLASGMATNSVLAIGSASTSESPLVRVHSTCFTGDVFGSQRCECGPQYEAAVDRIAEDPEGGYLVYMAGHEGRGIGLWAKAATYLLQDGGEDTYQANRSLGLPDDSRDFSDAASLLKYFGRGRPIRLLTNNPKKIDDLAAMGIQNLTRIKHVSGVNDSNRRYLLAKRERGHGLDESDLS